MSYPILPGAEGWSVPGSGERARVGLLLVHGITGSPASPTAADTTWKALSMSLSAGMNIPMRWWGVAKRS